MLTIDRLRLHLPPIFRDQAADIARLVGQELGNVSVPGAMHLERLVLPPIQAPAGAGSRELARAVAAAIGAGLRNARSGA